MDAKYKVTVTSADSATVEDIPLTPLDDSAKTRRLIRPTIVNNQNEAEASVQVTLMHQFRHKLKEPWQDADSFKLATLKGGEEVRLELGATETWRLGEALEQLYALGRNGVPARSGTYVALRQETAEDSLIVKGEARQVLEQLHGTYGDDLWTALAELQPDLLTTLAQKRVNDHRRSEIEKFRRVLAGGRGNESHWQKFFSDNLWIFGHGLDFRILDLLQEQPHYGGTTMTGKGGQRGDYLMSTAAAASFTVLVEIKTPQALLVEEAIYRNKAHRVGEDVAGGVAQLQSNCRTWATEGSRQEENAEALHEADIGTCEPKGILVVGDTRQLSTPLKRRSFESFRRNLHNPEILTFDELLARAQWIVANEEPEALKVSHAP